jgi:hypothetical protein
MPSRKPSWCVAELKDGKIYPISRAYEYGMLSAGVFVKTQIAERTVTFLVCMKLFATWHIIMNLCADSITS